MRRVFVFVILVCALLLALPAVPQMQEEGNVGFVAFLKPKPGMAKQFEEGMKKHRQWHSDNKDTTQWAVWVTVTGESVGTYGVGTFGHRWEDFDSPPVSEEADAADRAKTLDPYTESVVPQYYLNHKDISHPAEGEAKMYEVLAFHVRYGKGSDFMYCLRKFHEAIQKTKWPVHYEWYELRSGGELGTYVLVIPRDSFAAMKPMEKPFGAMLEEALGRAEAEALLEKFSDSVRYETSELIESRPDLSTPAQ